MLYEIFYPLRDYFFGFNVFRYITFRAALASITAFIVSLILAPRLIRFLHQLDARQTIKREGFSKLYKAHEAKEKTPTMGGLLILGAMVLSTLLWADLRNRYVWMCLAAVLWLGFVGFWDDYLKLSKKNSKGMAARVKILGQLVFGLAIGIYLYLDSPAWASIHVPYIKDYFLPIGVFYVLFVCFVIVGSSNAVNLTDGLDGLAIGCTAMVALTYGIMSYIAGNAKFSDYLQIPFVPGAGELAVFCSALLGAAMGFLWHNSYPASVFMGDVGSLGLGGVLGVIAVIIKKELLLLIAGGVFVAEAVSVILQVASFKLFKRRIFLMAPLHHHFQLKGVTESKVVIRFWIVSIILALWALASLKL